MKFRNRATGKEFDSINDARIQFMCPSVCEACNLGWFRCNKKWVEEHPIEAAELMGYEVVRQFGDNKTMNEQLEQKDKPRICRVLGVEVGERFDLPSPNRYYRDCFVTEDARVMTGTQKMGNGGLCWLYEHPDHIIRRPRFTEDEIAVAKMLAQYGTTKIERWIDGVLTYSFNGEDGMSCLPREMFPSLRPGQILNLPEMILENETVCVLCTKKP